MKLTNKYVIGVLVQFYEIKMLPEYIDSCIQALNEYSNKEDVIFDFCFNKSEHFEQIDIDKISIEELDNQFNNQLKRLSELGCVVNSYVKTNEDKIYNIASYRRDLNYNYCEDVDFVLWGETDSLWPKETFTSIETINEHAISNNVNRYIITFAYRKMWSPDWSLLEHIDMTDKQFIDTDEWNLNAPESPKSYMSLEQMNEINNKADELDIRVLTEPKFDGSCLVISSDLIKAGVNIPHALLVCGEDTSFADMAKFIMGNKYMQFVVKNILRVHNRRHPQKRLYIKDENNPRGFCDHGKGDWWKLISNMSKSNLSKLRNNQDKFLTFNDHQKQLGKL
jgi:hypothetical protein